MIRDEVHPDLDTSLRVVARRLSAKTSIGDIKWARIGDAGFLTHLGDASITIRSVDDDGRPPYRLAILDDNGIEIANLEWSVERSSYGTVVEGEYNPELAELYYAAQRSTTDVHRIVNDLLRRLSDDR